MVRRRLCALAIIVIVLCGSFGFRNKSRFAVPAALNAPSPKSSSIDEKGAQHSGQPTESLPKYGKFVGQVRTEWLETDNRSMRILADFGYVDPTGKLWMAPADSIVDGASIPWPFWSVIGGPFEGPYRSASVVHDVACERKIDQWKDVHRMFYHACRCGGAGEYQAKIMYWAVYHFGPRWVVKTKKIKSKTGVSVKIRFGELLNVPQATAKQVSAFLAYIKLEAVPLSLEELEQLEISQEGEIQRAPQKSLQKD
jgi:hypothetical protein